MVICISLDIFSYLCKDKTRWVIMDYNAGFIMQKTVDWSLLNDGLTIPVSVCALLKAWDESILTHGVGKDIKVLIEGELYEAKLKNQNFEQSNWAGHKDVIQIRYGRQSALAVKLRAVFKKSYDYLFTQKQLLGKSKRQILLPDDIHEYIRLYLTTSSDVLFMECCANADYQQLADTLNDVPEEVYEASDDDKFFMADKTASVVQKELLVKYRKIDRCIIRMLKEFYDYRDEISGERIGEQYGDSVRKIMTLRTSLSSVQITIASSTRTTLCSIARSSSLSSQMVRC